jgi:4-aminobutyrate aminotransferase-like enzyme/Ser/Thr protein kinase RdoA (MazF antagonist)
MSATETPHLTFEQATAILQRHWGITPERLVELGSYEDQNLRVDAGGRRYVLKVAGPAEARSPLELECEVLHALAAAPVGGTPVTPTIVPAQDGTEIVAADGHRVRLLTWVGGVPLRDLAVLDDGLLRGIGALAATSARALADFEPRTPAVRSKWDARIGHEVVDEVLADEPGPAPADRVMLRQGVAPLRGLLDAGVPTPPRQMIHGDVTDWNVLASAEGPGRMACSGLIDFGDATRTWRIVELANAMAAIACRDLDEPLHALLAVVAGFHAIAPLDAVELDLIWPLTLARVASSAALSIRQLGLTGESSYTVDQYDGDRRALQSLLALAPGLADAAIRVECGAEPLPGDPWPELIRSADPLPVVARRRGHDGVLDLSVETDELHDGDWADPRAIAALAAADHCGFGRWGEVRLSAAGEPADAAPDTLHLGADVLAAAATAVRTPLDAVVVAVAEREATLELAPGRCLRLAGIEVLVRAGASVTAGAVVGHVAERTDRGPARVHVQLTTAAGQPGLGDPRLRDAWLALCPDPSPLVGAEVAAPAPPDAAGARARRDTVVAGAQELYYARPMEMVRGYRQYLYDAGGRPYLDMVNNVAIAGHSHPRIAAAAARQFRRLNTNSRFLYDSMTDYAARLVALAPAGLDRVFLVNSGSEACDLALQLARVFTERRDVVVLRGAYHGWTSALMEICTGPDNPVWADTKPPFVRLAEQPDPYRGAYGDDAAAYVRSVADACAAAAADGGPAAFISEPLLGNQGAVTPPPGFLAGAYEATRAAGGVCIADEIQVGYGRTGESFWAFEAEDVVPDIIAVAKATGNGHPIGAVICRAEIAEALGRRAAFFSSTGGGPVSCEVGLAVLDVIADEGLQENAARVGGVLNAALRELIGAHEAIGAVHGRGLYQGIDLVADRDTREPAPAHARWVCERLRELGIVDQPTGDHGNVLKIKPPLCLTEADAARYVTVLDRVLTELGTVSPSR